MLLSLVAAGLLLATPPSEHRVNYETQVKEAHLSYQEAYQLQKESQIAKKYINKPQNTKKPDIVPEKKETGAIDDPIKTVDISYIKDSSTKTHMGYQKVTSKKSNTYKLLNSDEAFTDDDGYRCQEVEGQKRYFIAVGKGVSDEVGTLIDVNLSNGNVIYGIVGDRKANEHTDSNNIQQIYDGSVIEFIVDENTYEKGCHSEWEGNIDSIDVGTNIFKKEQN